MNPYEARQAARKARLEQAAQRRAAEAAAAYERSDRMADAIPMGQPILVGHHSEKRDRRYRERMHTLMRKGATLSAEARTLERQAAAVGTGGISSDDPDAIDKLRAKLAHHERLQELMTTANKLARKGDHEGLRRLSLTEREIVKLLQPDEYSGRVGFPPYALTNNNAEIRRLRDRITTLEAATTAAFVETRHEALGLTITEDPSDNRIILAFDERQPPSVVAKVKAHGFRWSPSRDGWVRQLNNAARHAATYLAETTLGGSA